MTPRDLALGKRQVPKDQAGQPQAAPDDAIEAGSPKNVEALHLFCFPYAGGGQPIFRRWQEGTSDDVEVHAVELPGRGRQFATPAARRIDVLVDAVLDGIEPLMHRRFAFFGHSMGALLSFEVARALQARHRVEPLALYVAAQPAPHLPSRQSVLHELSDAALRAELRRIGGTPLEVLSNDEFMALLLPTLRADFEVCETYNYAPSPPLCCPIVAYGGSEDAEVSEEDLQAWAELTTGAFALAMLPGGHFFIDDNRQALLAALDASLKLWH
jgi:medium-chain acyl-[acyl-carrier-protein] hydrolase